MYLAFFVIIAAIGYGSLLSNRLGVLLAGIICTLILFGVSFTDVVVSSSNTETVATNSITKNANNTITAKTSTNTTTTDTNTFLVSHPGNLEFTVWTALNMMMITLIAIKIFKIQTVDGWKFY